MTKDDEFIDAEEEGFSKEFNFETIIIRQIQKTADLLSQPLEPINFVKRGESITHQGDQRVFAINSVRVLRDLIKPFIADENTKSDIKKIYTDIEKFKAELGEKLIRQYGVGEVKVKDMMHEKSSVPYNMLVDYKLEKHRQLFSILIMAYNANKNEMQRLTIE